MPNDWHVTPMRTMSIAGGLLVLAATLGAAQDSTAFTHADSLRGSIGVGRAWWHVTFYDLHVRVDLPGRAIRGYNAITYQVTSPGAQMQIDLMTPLEVDSIVQESRELDYRRDGDAFFVTLVAPQQVGTRRTVTVYYHGSPRVAKRAPWDGGIV